MYSGLKKEKINYCIMPLTGTLWFFVIRLIERTTNLLRDPETVEMSLFFIYINISEVLNGLVYYDLPESFFFFFFFLYR